jgi:hypothetical protein
MAALLYFLVRDHDRRDTKRDFDRPDRDYNRRDRDFDRERGYDSRGMKDREGRTYDRLDRDYGRHDNRDGGGRDRSRSPDKRQGGGAGSGRPASDVFRDSSSVFRDAPVAGPDLTNLKSRYG